MTRMTFYRTRMQAYHIISLPEVSYSWQQQCQGRLLVMLSTWVEHIFKVKLLPACSIQKPQRPGWHEKPQNQAHASNTVKLSEWNREWLDWPTVCLLEQSSSHGLDATIKFTYIQFCIQWIAETTVWSQLTYTVEKRTYTQNIKHQEESLEAKPRGQCKHAQLPGKSPDAVLCVCHCSMTELHSNLLWKTGT